MMSVLMEVEDYPGALHEVMYGGGGRRREEEEKERGREHIAMDDDLLPSPPSSINHHRDHHHAPPPSLLPPPVDRCCAISGSMTSTCPVSNPVPVRRLLPPLISSSVLRDQKGIHR